MGAGFVRELIQAALEIGDVRSREGATMLILSAAIFGLWVWVVPRIEKKFDRLEEPTRQHQIGRLVGGIATVALVVIAYAIAAALGPGSAASDPYAIPDYRKWKSEKRETITGKTFTNETVEVDGKIFDRCTFQNVTFLYHGTATWTFISPNMKPGNLLVATDNKSSIGFARLSNFIRTFADDVGIGEQDPVTGKITIERRIREQPVEQKPER